MLNHHFARSFVASAALTLAFAAGAAAQNNRSFVATTGSDTNSCTASAFCRTFTRALAVTNSGGEIIVVDSGGYGPATISQPVTISANGIVASITQSTSGQDGLTINTSGNVALLGLSFHGQATGQTGILVQNVGTLFLYDVSVENFTENGLQVNAGTITVESSAFRLNGFDGISIGSGRTFVHNTTMTENSTAFLITGGAAVVVDSSASNNNGNGFQVGLGGSGGGTLDLIRSESVSNGATGVSAGTATSTIRMSYCIIAENSTNSFLSQSGGIISGTNPGTNVIVGSGTGALSTPVTLQ
jgi:hypothetical protein